MTLRHLEIFIQVYRTRNITHAAEELHMTQPAVTRAVQELERYYDVRLFERMHRRLYPTPAAQQLYPQALHLLDNFARIETDLHSQGTAGPLRVGATVTLGALVLPGLVRRFSDAHPSTAVTVTVANGGTIAAELCDNRLDLALLEGQVPTPELQAEAIGGDRLCALFAPTDPLASQPQLTLEQLSACPLLVREEGSTARTILNTTMALYDLPLRPAWESVSSDALLLAAAQGLGVAVLPEEAAAPLVRAGRLCQRDIVDAPLRRQWTVAWHREKYLTPLMQEFLALCRTIGETAAPQPQVSS